MKEVLLCIVLLTQVIANEDKSSTEAFLLKIGITSLVKDFEYEKRNINQNSQDIESLKRDIRYLMQQNLKLKLNIKDDIRIKKEDKKVLTQEKSSALKLRVAVEKSTLRSSPYSTAEIIKYVYRNEILILENCSNYGWCKLLNKDLYIPKFKLSNKKVL